jgi:hypothetical protein
MKKRKGKGHETKEEIMNKTWIRCMSLMAAMGIAGLAVTPGFATSMASQNLAALAKSAKDIVVGDVVRITEGRQGNLPYQEVEVSVSEAIQGAPGRTLKFRQFGTQAKQPAESGRRFIGQIPSMPQFTVGESVILFLGRPSSLGFRTTVGLQQGKFTVLSGNAANAFQNNGLFKNVPTGGATLSEKQQAMLATRQGGVHAGTFIDFVRQGVQKHWWK